MGKTFENLTWDDLCELMCGGPEEEFDEDRDTEDIDGEAILKECQETS